MRVIIVTDPEQLGEVAAQVIAEDMRGKRTYVLGLATGSTPIPVYRELIRLHREEDLDFSTTITFNLDEYVGLEPTHPQSYRHFMNEHLFDHVNINKKSTHVPDGLAEDVDAFCAAYEEMIEDVGGIDCQVLGIGSNGHVGFSEPGSSLSSRTHRATLTESTIRDNSRLFEKIEDVPTSAITMGIGTIMEAGCAILLANGENKADAVARAIEGPITATVPASALQMHPNATFVVTEDAASKLRLKWERAEHMQARSVQLSAFSDVP